MDTPSTSAEALKREIERIRGAIDQYKTHGPVAREHANDRPFTNHRSGLGSNKYVNPAYLTSKTSIEAPIDQPKINEASVSTDREVTIDGVRFIKVSGRSLVREGVPKPTNTGAPIAPHPPTQPRFMRNKAGTLMNSSRTYKPKISRRGRGRGRGGMSMNRTLDNTRAPYQSVPSFWRPTHSTFTSRNRSRRLAKQRKYSDKPCPRFTITGSCNRGLTCLYQHDPSKIAICWHFLQGNCPHTAETCSLSHNPTPERTPLCVHFANHGRCTRLKCPFPHVHVGPREGICRNFAVLGYCDKGLDCEKQHVRECPDFAEKGQCTKKGCKLPHVIRANRNRKGPATPTGATAPSLEAGSDAASSDGASSSRQITAEDGQLGDEFISLTFHESESEESGDNDDDDDDDESEDADEVEEGHQPYSDTGDNITLV